MLDSAVRLAARMLEEGEKTVIFFHALTSDQMERTLYADGARWTVRQVLAHFVATELAMTRLVENILAGGGGAAEDFDLNDFNERKVAALMQASDEELLEQFTAARQASARLVQSLEDSDLQKTGRHPFLGITPLGEILQLMYRHNQIHQRDIRKALTESLTEPHG